MDLDSQQSAEPAVDAPTPISLARIGLRWSALFWMPILLLAFGIAAISTADSTPFRLIFLVASTIASLLILVFAGRWWATRGFRVNDWEFLLAAVTQGLAWAVSLFLALAAAIGADGTTIFSAWNWSDFVPLYVGWGVCSIWMMALGAVVVWRVRRALARAHSRCSQNPSDDAGRPDTAGEEAPRITQEKRSQHFAVALIWSLGVPVLLCAPAVAMLRYDASQRAGANILLASQIRTIDAQLADIKDLEKVKTRVLARKQIVEVIEAFALRGADVLGALGTLPDGVQLLQLEMSESQLSLKVRCAAPDAERSLLDRLAQGGYGDLRISSRRREGDEAAELMSVEARSTRGAAQ